MTDEVPSGLYMPVATPATATLLLVDDEPSILSSLRRLLRTQGYRILVAESGASALELAATERVDLVISDMRMPEMDGARFLQRMRLEQPHALRILLTGYADINSTIAAINGGEIHRYIAKPWDDNDLLLVVREALARRALEVENKHLAQVLQQRNEELSRLNASLEKRVSERTAEIIQVNALLNTANDELRSNFMLSMQIFAGLMELRHNGMSGHSRQVAELARRMCTHLRLDEELSHDIYVAALLHDIGKIGFPDGLLRKPISNFTAEEMARYRKHPLTAEAALMPLAQLRRVAKFVREQHERIDGHGFPDGLRGQEISFGARVIAPIIDYENLVSGRLAEQRFSPAEALNTIARASGGRYDPAIVLAFCEVLQLPPPDPPHDKIVSPLELSPGMVLARDLCSPQGTLLLAAGFVVDERIARHIREFAQREGIRLRLYVCIEPPAKSSSTTAARN